MNSMLLLVKEFGKDLPNGGRERERVVPERSHREASSVKEEKSSEIKTVIPEEFRPKIVTKGRIDLDRPHKKVQEVQHQPVSVPVEKESGEACGGGHCCKKLLMLR